MNDYLIGTVLYNVYQFLQTMGLSLDAYFYAISAILLFLAMALMYLVVKKIKVKSTRMASVVLAFLLSLLSMQTFAITTYADKELAQSIITASAEDVKKNQNAQQVLNKYEAIANKKENEISVSSVLAYHYDIRTLNENKQ